MPVVNPVACVSSAAPVKVTSRVPRSTASAKAYFKAAGQQTEYYVDMRRAADGSMWGFIPAPAPSTPSFTYRVVSTDPSGHQESSTLHTATPATSCPAQQLTTLEQNVASNMVIGLLNASQSPVPPGFLCRGIVSYITATGELRPNDECRRLIASGVQPGAAGTAGGTTASGVGTAGGAAGAGATGVGGPAGAGLSNGTLLGLGAAGLLGAGVIIIRQNNKDNRPISNSRP
jgi:hypothetical protein